MQQGICPNCQSTEIYAKHDVNRSNRILIARFRTFRPHIFVCADCGYMMQFVHPKYLNRIRNHWLKIGNKPKRKRKNDNL